MVVVGMDPTLPHVTLLQALERAGLAGGSFERALFAVLARVEPFAVVESVDPGVAVLRFLPAGTPALLVAGDALPEAARLGELVRPLLEAGIEACVVSDDDEAPRELLRRLQPSSRRRVAVYRLDSAGGLHGRVTKAAMRPALSGALQHPTAADWDALPSARQGQVERLRALGEEQARFATTLRRRGAPATYAFLAVMGAMFALELGMSSEFSVWMLNSLGALVRSKVAQGEWWRVVSCAFVHGSLQHMLFNGMALYMLGGSVERVLGTPRYLALFGLSLVSGSLLSLARLGAGVSVGASGAVWGILGAEAVLLLHPRSALPQLVKQRARQSVLVNLGINVLVSFLPHVDWAAHLGGAVAGAGLAVLSVQLEAEPGGPAPGWLKVVAGLVVVGTLGSVGTALWSSRPLRDFVAPGAVEQRAVHELGMEALELPALVAGDGHPRPPREGEPPSVTYGDLSSAPLQVDVTGAAVFPPLEADAMADAVADLVERLDHPRDGDTVLARAKVERREAETLVTARRTLPNGLSVEVAVRLTPRAWARVDLATWPEQTPRWAGAARRIAESVRWVREAPPPGP